MHMHAKVSKEMNSGFLGIYTQMYVFSHIFQLQVKLSLV